MQKHSRVFDIRRESVNPESGEFEAVLFTDGEASDGHILNIAGGKIPQQMPLFVNHWADPETQLGSLYRKQKTDHEVVVRGKIVLEGEGAPADVRRDILLKMALGHVTRMSGRWDADEKDVKRRTELEEKHPAYVPKDAPSPKRYGLYFDKWRAMEGSVVGLGADPQAMIRWSEDEASPEPVRAFWREQSEIADYRAEVERENERPNPADFGTEEDFMEECVPAVVEEGKDNDQAVAQCKSMWENRSGEFEAVMVPSQTGISVIPEIAFVPELQEPAREEPIQPESEPEVPEIVEQAEAIPPAEVVAPPTLDSQLAAFDAYVRDMERQGIDTRALADRLKERSAATELIERAQTLTEQLDTLLSQVAEKAGVVFERKQPEPEPPPPDPAVVAREDVIGKLNEALEALERETKARAAEREAAREELFSEPDEPEALEDETEPEVPVLSPEVREKVFQEVKGDIIRALDEREPEAPLEEPRERLADIPRLLQERLDAMSKRVRDHTAALLEEATGRKPT